ncbi:DUF1315 family protein [Serratia symbiotica]|uniref:YeaC family protein n=1 Tax=Serratia symbiotica TaxID=138074 RepID=UPI001D76540B|nr:DUF1315 family protein [Serratia symbiotica]NIG87771.1 DUF1315 family protein [Serratia symbiotica]USS96472.1 DUF1315 family protein [Serratia symbiotica]
MDLQDLIAAMTPEIYQRLLRAVELGKWQDGIALTPEQKANSLQAVMLWQSKNNVNPQHMSIGTNGQMVMKSKQQFVAEPLVKLKPK